MKDINSVKIPSTTFTNISTVEVRGHSSSADVKFKVCNYADLAVTSTPTTPIGHICENLTYVIKVVNKGPSKSTGVILTDLVPKSACIISINLSQGSYKYSNGKITCYLGELNCNAKALVVIVVLPKLPCIIRNRSFITANENDPNYNNNFFVNYTKICYRSY